MGSLINQGRTCHKKSGTVYDDFVVNKRKQMQQTNCGLTEPYDNSQQSWFSCDQTRKQRSPYADRFLDGQTPVTSTANVQPKYFLKGAKEKMIAYGFRVGRHDYKTMDDVYSDWNDTDCVLLCSLILTCSD
ncbi:unnamed protein product [Anisakis simplex]|uniref:Peptidase M12A domain-containing protein n=1 Tax=Anisakis simplex TaxID=6269 RepID=A0A0M3JAH2_ANISI|nr:unnamed protein product [Anisakis simplex]